MFNYFLIIKMWDTKEVEILKAKLAVFCIEVKIFMFLQKKIKKIGTSFNQNGQ